jgi:hypothetical protein
MAAGRTARPGRSQGKRPRLGIERLEDRVALAVLTVTSLADSGNGTLRDAIANAADGDEIDFAVCGTIQLKSTLTVQTAVFINGDTAPGYSGLDPTVFVSGGAGATMGFQIEIHNEDGGSGADIRALGIVNCADVGVDIIDGNDNTIEDCDIGNNGTQAAPNGDGIRVEPTLGNTSNENNIGHGDTLSGNTGWAVVLSDAQGGTCDHPIVEGDRIGTTRLNLDSALSNGGGGIEVIGTNAAVVGMPGQSGIGNDAIKFNQGTGVLLTGASNATVAMDVIDNNRGEGVSATNCTSLAVGGGEGFCQNPGDEISGNRGYGVALYRCSTSLVQSNDIGDNAIAGIYLQNCVVVHVGGPASTTGNTITGNQVAGVIVVGPYGSQVVIQGNLIFGNRGSGVAIEFGASQVTVGGAFPGPQAPDRLGNVICVNFGNGVSIESSNNMVQGNLIGLDPDGETNAGNQGWGVYVDGTDNVIGDPDLVQVGAATNLANRIADNGKGGGLIDGSGSDDNVVAQNWIGTIWDRTSILDSDDESTGNLGVGWGINGGSDNVLLGNLIVATKPSGEGGTAFTNGNAVSVVGSSASDNVIAANWLGIYGLFGNLVGLNAGHGVFVDQAVNTVVGGSDETPGNVIAGNGGFGVMVTSGTKNTVIDYDTFDQDAQGNAAPNVLGALSNNDPSTVVGTHNEGL